MSLSRKLSQRSTSDLTRPLTGYGLGPGGGGGGIPAAANLLGAWNLDEAVDQNRLDFSGLSHPFVPVDNGANKVVYDAAEDAAYFDGLGGYLDNTFNYTVPSIFSNGNLGTIAIWVKNAEDPYADWQKSNVMHTGNGDTNHYPAFGSIYAGWGRNNRLTVADTGIDKTAWHVLAVVLTDTSYELWQVDGTLGAVKIYTTGPWGATPAVTRWRLGNSLGTAGQWYWGWLKGCALWDINLSENDLLSYWNNGSPIKFT